MKSFYFLKRDLRLHDNRALSAAVKKSKELNIVYVLDQSFLEMSSAQKHFVFQSLADLNRSLVALGSVLFVYKGEAPELIADCDGVTSVFMSKTYNSRDEDRLRSLKDLCFDKGIECFEIENTCLYDQKSLPFTLESMPKVFTSFRKKIEKESLEINNTDLSEKIPKYFASAALNFESARDFFSECLSNDKFQGGETAGLERLNHYLWQTDAAQTYKETRNGMLIFDDSTKLSPWLAVGALSPRKIMLDLKEYEKERGANESTYWIYFELMWREYFKLYSLKYSKRIFELSGIGQKRSEFPENQENLFLNWSTGCTGNDFVDANMRELLTTGWMSNRGRQNVASYLSKEIFVDWRKGASWFAKNLLDYDVESNWGNWNYLAGVGVDPRDRKFNTSRQADMYDPNGEYVSKFLGL